MAVHPFKDRSNYSPEAKKEVRKRDLSMLAARLERLQTEVDKVLRDIHRELES